MRWKTPAPGGSDEQVGTVAGLGHGSPRAQTDGQTGGRTFDPRPNVGLVRLNLELGKSDQEGQGRTGTDFELAKSTGYGKPGPLAR